MAGEEIEHMVEKADAGRDFGHAGSIEVHGTSMSVSLVLRLIVAVRIETSFRFF
jgi:hypothetical protein